jgi:hypothetical protein
MGSVGITAKAAIVISCAKKSAAFYGRLILKRGKRIMIYCVSIIPQIEFKKAEILSWESMDPMPSFYIPALLLRRTGGA